MFLLLLPAQPTLHSGSFPDSSGERLVMVLDEFPMAVFGEFCGDDAGRGPWRQPSQLRSWPESFGRQST